MKRLIHRQPRAIPQGLDKCIVAFIEHAQKTGFHLGETPARAKRRCHEVASAFMWFARGFGLDATVLNVVGCRVQGSKMFALSDSESHYLTWFPRDKLAVDFTSRQFWIATPCPFIMNRATLKAYWIKIKWP